MEIKRMNAWDFYNAGIAAFHAGEHADTNPYKRHIEVFEWRAWNMGFEDAELLRADENGIMTVDFITA